MTLNLIKLHNTYFMIRHGKSLANEQGIIVSDPNHGTHGYGLSELGKSEVKQSVETVKSESVLDDSVLIISSDFTRAKETAEIVADTLGTNTKNIEYTAKLRERSFGKWEMTSTSNYQKVWEADDAGSPSDMGVENVGDVLKRALSVITDLEAKYVGRKILLVSHGDVIQILLTIFNDADPTEHRSLEHVKTGEIRKLN